MSNEASQSANTTSIILDWLTAQPANDLADELQNLCLHLDALHSPSISRWQFHQCIELFFSRTLRLCGEHRKTMRAAAFPLEDTLLLRTRTLADITKRVAQGFERVITDTDGQGGKNHKRLNETASARALRLLGEQFLIVSQSGLEIEPDLWKIAYRLYALSRTEAGSLEPTGSPAESALYAYKRLLGMVSLEPQGLSPAELDWSAEFLARISGQVHVQEQRPPALDGAWYWLDPYGGAEPQACVRRQPPEGKSLLYFSTSALARRAAEQIARHEGGRELGPEDSYPGVQPATLLDRLRHRWAAPSKRELPRRKHDYKVEACVGLPSIWQVLRGGSDIDPSLITQWSVINESPGGFAIMHLQGRCNGLVAGMSVALRRSEDDNWNICIVRWIRSDSADQVEIGLQMVSRGALAVRVGFRGDENTQGMVKALVLPVLPALRQHQAVMAPSGTYVSRRFALVSDIDRVYIAQCRLLSLDMQTSNVELFQFEIDPYPI